MADASIARPVLGARAASWRWRRYSTTLIGLCLIAPVLAYFTILFFGPIGGMLFKGVFSPEVPTGLPSTVAAMETWDGPDIPSESVFAALVEDMKRPDNTKEFAHAARRLNYEIPGYRSLLLKTRRKIKRAETGPFQPLIIEADARWAEPEYWHALKRSASAYTLFYLLSALDLEERDDGSIGRVPDDQAIFIKILMRTLWIATVVTIACIVLGFPVAYQLATVSPRVRGYLILFVLLPFWTSLLVRTSAWVILLQDQGIVNGLLVYFGLIEKPLRLMFSRTGVYIAFIHVMLPFVVLPLFSVMRGISKEYMRAAAGLGAPPMTAFFRVYLPLVWPGVWSGGLLCFVICVGYYITPALIGGPGDQMISYFIAFYTTQTVNWGLASALGILLTICVLLIFVVYSRVGRTGAVSVGT